MNGTNLAAPRIFLRSIAAVHSEDKNFPMYEHFGYQVTNELFDNGTHGWLTKSLRECL